MKSKKIIYILGLMLSVFSLNYCSDDNLGSDSFDNSSFNNSFASDDQNQLSPDDSFLTQLSTAIYTINAAENKDFNELFMKLKKLVENNLNAVKKVLQYQDKMKPDESPYTSVFLQSLNAAINQIENRSVAQYLYDHKFKFLNNLNFPEFAQNEDLLITKEKLLESLDQAFKEMDTKKVQSLMDQNDSLIQEILTYRAQYNNGSYNDRTIENGCLNNVDIISNGLFKSSPEIATILETIGFTGYGGITPAQAIVIDMDNDTENSNLDENTNRFRRLLELSESKKELRDSIENISSTTNIPYDIQEILDLSAMSE